MKQSFFEWLVCSIVIAVCSLNVHAQFASPTYSQSLYPAPVLSTDYLDNINTKYLSNFSTDRSLWPSKCPMVVGWTFDESVGGGGTIMVGVHLTTSPSSTFTEEVRFNVPNAVDLRVGWMGNDLIVASYWDASVNQYVFSWWNWAGPGFGTVTYGGTTTLPTSGPTPVAYERISMDITTAGDEAYIVFSDQGKIYGVNIYLSGPTPTLASPPVDLTLLIGPSGINPDLSLNNDGGLTVYYTYTNILSGQQYTYSAPPSTFGGASTGVTLVGLETLPSGISVVNFDCPDYYNQGHWAYTYSDGNNIYVRASDGVTPFTTILTDASIGGTGSTLPTDISAYNNTVPKLAYKVITTNDDIFVVWASDAPNAFSTGYTNTFIGTTIQVTGSSAPRAHTSGDYVLIDNDPNAYCVTGQPLIALDRTALKSDRYVAWITDHAVNGIELKHKNITFFDNYYRTASLSETATAASQLKLYPNPFSNGLYLEVPNELKGQTWGILMFDLFGRTVSSYSGEEPQQFLRSVGNKLAAGTYFLKLQTTGSEPVVVKVDKQ